MDKAIDPPRYETTLLITPTLSGFEAYREIVGAPPTAGVPSAYNPVISRTLQAIVIISVLIFSLILILSAFGYTVKM